MKYQIVCNGAKLSQSTTDSVIETLSKLEKFIYKSEEMECRVVIKFINEQSKVEVSIPTPYLLLRSEAIANDVVDATTYAKEKLEKQIEKVKAKLNRSSNKINLGKTFYVEEEDDDNQDIYVKNKTIHPSAMTLDDAIMQMEGLGHDFYIYEDIEDHTISVVYVRKNGGYGVIEIDE